MCAFECKSQDETTVHFDKQRAAGSVVSEQQSSKGVEYDCGLQSETKD